MVKRKMLKNNIKLQNELKIEIVGKIQNKRDTIYGQSLILLNNFVLKQIFINFICFLSFNKVITNK